MLNLSLTIVTLQIEVTQDYLEIGSAVTLTNLYQKLEDLSRNFAGNEVSLY